MAKILIVEDDNHLREIYELRMQAAGHEVVAAVDGEEALKIAIQEKPDLIISDVMMPKISGFDMLDILRSTEETKHAKIIMMTALSQAEDKQRADNLGADRYLVKSQVTLDDVAQVTEEVLNGTSPSASSSSKPEEDIQQLPGVSPKPDTASSSSTPPVATPTPEPPVQTPVVQTDENATPVTVAQQPALVPMNNDAQAAQTTTQTSSHSIPQTQDSASDISQQAISSAGQNTPNQSTVVSVDPQSVDSEESAIAKQIEEFMHTNDGEPTLGTQSTVEQPSTSTADEAPKATETNKATSSSVNEQPTAPSSEEAQSRKKKVIQPIDDLAALKADELNNILKKEEVREEMSKIVTDIKTQDIVDPSIDNSAEQAPKEAQSGFNEGNNTQAPAAQESTQDTQVTQDGKIVEDAEEAAAAQILKNAQEQKTPQQPTTAPPQSSVPPVVTQTPQADTTTPATPPVIPHTNGTAIDGVMPTQPTTTPVPSSIPAPVAEEQQTDMLTQPAPPVQSQAPEQQVPVQTPPSTQQGSNPNDIAL